MNKIEIIHNPFTVETQFLINGQSPARGCKLSSYTESRLQVWVEKLFDELDLLFNGDNRYEITFTGVESDYLDIEEAAKATVESRGAKIKLHWNEADSSEARLGDIHALMKEAKEHPKFKRFIEDNTDAQQLFEEAFNRDFDVYVVATMSSGKSTLINAMLGCDLLPAANEATTARIARITDNQSMSGSFNARRLNKQGKVLESLEDARLDTIQKWNSEADTACIDIEGNIKGFQERADVRLVLTDTPGPNNSQDSDHQKTTIGHVQDSTRNPLILYVLNGTQLGTDDDRRLLGYVAETMRKGGKQSKDRFVFVVNKMDEFDPSREHIPSVLERVKKYLSGIGIQNPAVYPISANLARLVRKREEDRTRKERGELIAMADLFEAEESMKLPQYMQITSRVSESLKRKELAPLLVSSGVPAVEAMIDEYIDKYNFPHRVKRAYDALLKTIAVGMNEASVFEQLDTDQKELKRIDEELEALRQRQEQGFTASEFRDRLKLQGMELPQEVVTVLDEREKQPRIALREISAEFQGEADVAEAKSKVSAAEKEIRMEYNRLVSDYEALFERCQELIRQDLSEKYQRYIGDLFEESRNLNLPIFEGLQKKIGSISFNLKITKDEVKSRRVRVGTREVSDSTWYKPWSWFSTRDEAIHGEEEYVNLHSVWQERMSEVNGNFRSLSERAASEINSMKNKLIDHFVEFMTEEFEERFNEILDELKGKASEQKKRKAAIREAEELRAWIDAFKGKLDATLAV